MFVWGTFLYVYIRLYLIVCVISQALETHCACEENNSTTQSHGSLKLPYIFNSHEFVQSHSYILERPT